MAHSNSPKDGDFVSYLETKSREVAAPREPSIVSDEDRRQTLQGVSEEIELTEEFVEELMALRGAPEMSDDELERQALAAPGGDGDPRTPE